MAVIAMDMTYPRLLLGAVNKKSMKKINRYARRDSNDRQSWYSYGDVLKYYERKWCFKVVFLNYFFIWILTQTTTQFIIIGAMFFQIQIQLYK